MDKARLIKIIEKIPRDLIDNTYSMDAGSRHGNNVVLQMDFNPKVLSDFRLDINSLTIDGNGFLQWQYRIELDTEIYINIVMT